MRKILDGVIVVTVILWGMSFKVHALNLEGAELVEYGNCYYNLQLVECAVYTKENVLYLFYKDDRSIFAVYRVNDGATKPYGPSDTVLVWERKVGKEA